jgi:hypothetical protein
MPTLEKVAAHHIFQLEPNNTSNYVALCEIYRSLGMTRGVSTVRAKMRGLSLVKTPGCSWINIAGRPHKFYQGDLSHPLSHMIFQILYVISNTQLSTNEFFSLLLLMDILFHCCFNVFFWNNLVSLMNIE